MILAYLYTWSGLAAEWLYKRGLWPRCWANLWRVVVFGLLASAAFGQAKPDPKLTPGVVRTSDAKEICAPTFRTKPFRKTTSAMKKHVCDEYHVKPCPAAGKMEIDHLLPLELGGLDDERNLWPQMAPEFHWKDALENKLRHLVCIDKTLDLPTAQQEIMTDWPAAYRKYIGALPASP